MHFSTLDDFPDVREPYLPARLRIFARFDKDALRFLEQVAFEKQQRAVLLKSLDDYHVLFLNRVTRLPPLQVFCQLAFKTAPSQGRVFYWTTFLFPLALVTFYGLVAARRWVWWIRRVATGLAIRPQRPLD